MPRRVDDPINPDDTFDDLIREIQMRDATPRPAPAFVGSLQAALLAPPRRARAGAGPSRPGWAVHRWAGLAATIALLIATVGGGYLSGTRLPGRGGAATNIAAPMTGSPEAAELVTPAASPVAVDRKTSADCTREKTYMSSPGGQLLLQSPELFSEEATSIDQMQLQHWSLSPDLGRAFPPSEMAAIDGLVMDTVSNGVYRATFDGPVIVSTAYGAWLSGYVPTALSGPRNTVELGVGESVLFEAGTAHEIVNISASRGLGIERLLLFSGDGSDLLPTPEPVARTTEAIQSLDSETGGSQGITVRLDGTGTIAPGDVPAGWRNAVISTEFVISYTEDPLTVLVPPSCESLPARQARDVEEMRRENGQYIGYLVWFWEGGRG